MPDPKKLKGALKAIEELDPVNRIVALRSAAKADRAAEVLGLPSNVNLPAAWAGNKGALTQAQRAISEKETGLASPSRRKFLKQSAATAARSALPAGTENVLAGLAGRSLVKEALTGPTDAEIQAALAGHTDKHLRSSKSFDQLIDEMFGMDETPGGPLTEKFSLPALAKALGLRPERLDEYLVARGAEPGRGLQDVVHDLSNAKQWTEGVLEDPLNHSSEDLYEMSELGRISPREVFNNYLKVTKKTPQTLTDADLEAMHRQLYDLWEAPSFERLDAIIGPTTRKKIADRHGLTDELGSVYEMAQEHKSPADEINALAGREPWVSDNEF